MSFCIDGAVIWQFFGALLNMCFPISSFICANNFKNSMKFPLYKDASDSS
ncbi:hypothetical protein Hanom_Chr15g01354871 [Helianthus anomalus]